jgi:hypothetical protein
MSHQLRNLGRNLSAGLRLAVFRPVTILDFRIGIAEVLLLLVVSAVLDLAGDWLHYGPGGQISWYGAGSEFFGAGILLVSAALLSLAFGRKGLTLAIPVIALAAYPAIQIVHTLSTTIPALPDWLEDVRTVFDVAVMAWGFVVLMRVVAVSLLPDRGPVWPRALPGGLLLAAPLFFSSLLMPSVSWWRGAGPADVDARYPNPASEPVLASQQTLLDDALAALEDSRSGQPDLYFVGFAGDARDDAYRADVLAAKKAMDDRWDTRDRSIALVNAPATLLQLPMATVTHLRETLKEVAAAINPDEDIVLIYLAGPTDRDGNLGVRMPPLELAQLSPATLRSLLDEAGIRWRVVVVSACNSDGFVDALGDVETLVIAAAGTSGDACPHGAASTPLGDALFGDTLAGGDSIGKAIEAARDKTGARLAAGPAITEKLRSFDRGRAARRAGQTI